MEGILSSFLNKIKTIMEMRYKGKKVNGHDEMQALDLVGITNALNRLSDEIQGLKAILLKGPSYQNRPVTTSEVSKRWGKSRTTLIKLKKEGKIMPIGRYGKEFIYEPSDIIAVLGTPLK
jgi:hypothetical protein